MPPHARVLVADDHRMFRDAVELFLCPHYEVVPGVGSVTELDSAFVLGGFDVALIDLSWGAEGGIFPRIPRLIDLQPTIPLLLLTAYNDPSLCRTALDLGMYGYLLKESRLDDLLPGIAAALSGQRYISPHMDRLGPKARPGFRRKLSRFDYHILRLLAERVTCREIARATGRHQKSIRYHMTKIRKAYAFAPDIIDPWPAILAIVAVGDVDG